MAADTAYAKRVLLACNGGGDAVSRGVAVGLARHGCRYSLSLFPFFFLSLGSESKRARTHTGWSWWATRAPWPRRRRRRGAARQKGRRPSRWLG